MAIASNPAILCNLHNLPPHWTVLEMLAKLPPKRLDKLVHLGKITDKSGRKDIIELMPELTETESPFARRTGIPAPSTTATIAPEREDEPKLTASEARALALFEGRYVHPCLGSAEATEGAAPVLVRPAQRAGSKGDSSGAAGGGSGAD
jgi:hypothetical protein